MGSSTLLVNATVLTMEPGAPVARAVAIRDGRIAAVGDSETLLRRGEPRSTVVDLDGRPLLPGFVDPHNHFAIAALQGFWADCRTPPLRTIADVQAALRATAVETPPGEWVRGVGYHHQALAERRHPTRQDLDEAVPGRPALLLHFTHHQGVANSAALAAADITRATADPPGGEIVRDRSGEPTGLLFERAMAAVERASREGWERRFPDVVGAASRRYAAAGLTTVQDAAVAPAMEARYREAERTGALAIRVARMAVSAAGWFEPPWDRAREDGRGGTLKVFVDGGYRCAMRLVRDGRATVSGFLFYGAGELAELLVTAWRHGWRVTCHAIGNLGVETCIDAIEAALRREAAGEGQIRLDHAIFLDPALIGRLHALGILVVTQPSFVYDLEPAGLAPDLVRLPFARLRDARVPQAFSSDYPCGSLAPLTGIYAAATRRTRNGRTADAEEPVPVAAALAGYTIDAARAMGLEGECGSITPGKRADLVVLDQNPLEVPPDALRDVAVVQTFVAGRQVWP
jgi:predicted amidohydrolase YtcJ